MLSSIITEEQWLSLVKDFPINCTLEVEFDSGDGFGKKKLNKCFVMDEVTVQEFTTNMMFQKQHEKS